MATATTQHVDLFSATAGYCNLFACYNSVARQGGVLFANSASEAGGGDRGNGLHPIAENVTLDSSCELRATNGIL